MFFIRSNKLPLEELERLVFTLGIVKTLIFNNINDMIIKKGSIETVLLSMKYPAKKTVNKNDTDPLTLNFP